MFLLLLHTNLDEPYQALLQEAIAGNLPISDLAERIDQVISSLTSDQPQRSEPPRCVIIRRIKAIYQRVGQIKHWDAATQKDVEKLLNKLEEKIQTLSDSSSD